jgi:hypothetical protein
VEEAVQAPEEMTVQEHARHEQGINKQTS